MLAKELVLESYNNIRLAEFVDVSDLIEWLHKNLSDISRILAGPCANLGSFTKYDYYVKDNQESLELQINAEWFIPNLIEGHPNLAEISKFLPDIQIRQTYFDATDLHATISLDLDKWQNIRLPLLSDKLYSGFLSKYTTKAEKESAQTEVTLMAETYFRHMNIDFFKIAVDLGFVTSSSKTFTDWFRSYGKNNENQGVMMPSDLDASP